MCTTLQFVRVTCLPLPPRVWRWSLPLLAAYIRDGSCRAISQTCSLASTLLDSAPAERSVELKQDLSLSHGSVQATVVNGPRYPFTVRFVIRRLTLCFPAHSCGYHLPPPCLPSQSPSISSGRRSLARRPQPSQRPNNISSLFKMLSRCSSRSRTP